MVGVCVTLVDGVSARFAESEFCLVETTIPVPGSDGVELPARYIIPATKDEDETFPLLFWIPGEGIYHLFSRGLL